MPVSDPINQPTHSSTDTDSAWAAGRANITCRVLSQSSTINGYFAEGLPATFEVLSRGEDGVEHRAEFFTTRYNGIIVYLSENNWHVRLALECDKGIKVSTYIREDGHQMMVLSDCDLSADELIAPGEFFVPSTDYCRQVVDLLLHTSETQSHRRL